MKKRNKAYKQRRIDPNPVDWVIAGALLMQKQKQDALIGVFDTSLDAMIAGTASDHDWMTVATGIHVSESFTHFKIGANLLPEIQEAINAIHDVGHRIIASGAIFLLDTELDAIRHGRDIYKEQLAVCSQSEADQALKRLVSRHRSGVMRTTEQMRKKIEDKLQEVRDNTRLA